VPADVAIVISRSATDLEARIRAIAESDAPPALVVAASDLPKPELVKAASKAGVGGFLVLPASSAQLKGLLARVPEPAAAG
jgi:AmiR/NasT family two-component response regulator